MIKVCKQASCALSRMLYHRRSESLGAAASSTNHCRSAARIGPRERSRICSVEPKSGPAPVVEPTDLIIVEVLEALPGRPISGERLVRPDGTISLGFYGDVHVAGLTLPEIKEKIVLHLGKFLDDDALPGLIRLDNHAEPLLDPSTGKPMMKDARDADNVFVDMTASAQQPGVLRGRGCLLSEPFLPYTGHDTVLDVIHYVGGIMPSAERSKIVLIRSFPKGSPVKFLPIDYEEITMGTDSTTNYQLLPGDRLVVPSQPGESSQPRVLLGAPSQARPSPSRTSATLVRR